MKIPQLPWILLQFLTQDAEIWLEFSLDTTARKQSFHRIFNYHLFLQSSLSFHLFSFWKLCSLMSCSILQASLEAVVFFLLFSHSKMQVRITAVVSHVKLFFDVQQISLRETGTCICTEICNLSSSPVTENLKLKILPCHLRSCFKQTKIPPTAINTISIISGDGRCSFIHSFVYWTPI